MHLVSCESFELKAQYVICLKQNKTKDISNVGLWRSSLMSHRHCWRKSIYTTLVDIFWQWDILGCVRSYSLTPRPPNHAAHDLGVTGQWLRGVAAQKSLLSASSLLLSSITSILSPPLRSLCLPGSDTGWTQRRQSSSQELRVERVERHLQALLLVLHFPHGHRNNPPAD